MRFSSSQAGSESVLLAFNGEIIGGVQCADTQTGELIRIDPDTGTVQNLSGHVAFIGEQGDPPALLEARLDAVRGYLASNALINGPVSDCSKLQPKNLTAYSLECLARRIREGTVTEAKVTYTKDLDYLPLPEGSKKVVATGKMTAVLEYESTSLKQVYEDEKTLWSREHPELVVEYIRNKPDVPA